MQKTGMFLLVLCLISGAGLMAWSEEGTPSGPPALVVVSAGKMDVVLVDRVCKHVEMNFPLAIRRGTPVEWNVDTLDAVAHLVSDQLTEDAFGILVFAMPTQAIAETSTTWPDGRTVVVNVSALQDADPEKLGRRTERIAIQGLAELVGLESCPNPRCALRELDETYGLDDIGRGLCPPCLVRAQGILEGRQ